MFDKILIANRGEIAVRIIRACRELGVRTVAVCSTADRDALHAQIADETVCIGPAPTRESYLNMRAVISACEITGAAAVHPGFGFLSENAAFAKLLRKCSIKFIGPSPESIERMGDKANAKKTMKAAGVPVIPGSEGVVEDAAAARAVAEEIGYPVMIKASAGGGGRGIRLVKGEDELENAFTTARQEALQFFGCADVYIEKYIVSPRHVEVQILADEHGNVLHFGERDCSLQRRNQKVLEESPCPAAQMTPELRARMGAASVAAARAVGYENAGTVEYLLDARGDFYFMEMNTRIQVEHPITEMVYGVDLVGQQIKIAAGEPLTLRQEDIRPQGHAIECRINAENPAMGFRPSPGEIRSLYMPGGPGIRIDSAMYAGYVIPPYYDSMIAKLIAYAPTREEAIAKMRWALAEFIVDGVDTNIDFQLSLIADPHFVAADYDNSYLTRRLEAEEKQKAQAAR